MHEETKLAVVAVKSKTKTLELFIVEMIRETPEQWVLEIRDSQNKHVTKFSVYDTEVVVAPKWRTLAVVYLETYGQNKFYKRYYCAELIASN